MRFLGRDDLSLLSITVAKMITKGNLERKGFLWLTYSRSQFTVENQGRDLETGAEAEVIEKPFSDWLPRFTFSYLSSVFQKHLPRDGATTVDWVLPRQS